MNATAWLTARVVAGRSICFGEYRHHQETWKGRYCLEWNPGGIVFMEAANGSGLNGVPLCEFGRRTTLLIA
jgi:hypothetical protein